MAVPTIASVSPSTVWAGGQVVTITGTGFRVAAAPSYALFGRYPQPKPSVAVTFGTRAGTRVRVLSATQLEVLAPAQAPATVGLTVQNLDDNGVAIGGESATLASALTYARPALDASVEPDIRRVDRAVLRMLKERVIENVARTVHTDYSETPHEAALVATLPALLVSGPTFREPLAGYHRTAETETGGYAGVPGGSYEARRAPLCFDLGYEVTGLTASEAQLIALQALTIQALRRAARLVLDRDANDPAAGTVAYDLDVEAGSEWRQTGAPNPDNVRSFVGSFVVRGVLLEGVAGFTNEDLARSGGVVDTITLGTVDEDGQ